MHKTTLYLPEQLELAVDAEARALGMSKAEYMRDAIERRTTETRQSRKRRRKPYTMLTGGPERPRTMEEIDDAIYESMKRRVSKR